MNECRVICLSLGLYITDHRSFPLWESGLKVLPDPPFGKEEFTALPCVADSASEGLPALTSSL